MLARSNKALMIESVAISAVYLVVINEVVYNKEPLPEYDPVQAFSASRGVQWVSEADMDNRRVLRRSHLC